MLSKIVPLGLLALTGGVLAGVVTAPSATDYTSQRPMPIITSSLPTSASNTPSLRTSHTRPPSATTVVNSGKAKGKKNGKGKGLEKQKEEDQPADTGVGIVEPSATEGSTTQSATGSETLLTGTESNSLQE